MAFALDAWMVNAQRFGFSLAVAVLIALAALAVHRWARSKASGPKLSLKRSIETMIVLFSAAMIGALIGDLSGSGPQSIAGQLVPAILTLIGGFAVYLFGKKRDEAGLINIAVLAFIVSLSLSYTNGQITRNDKDAFIFCRDKTSDPALIGNPLALKFFASKWDDYCADAFSRYASR